MGANSWKVVIANEKNERNTMVFEVHASVST